MLDKQTRLGELEGVIERGLTTFVEVGNAIREIRDSKLYKESHDTFEAYCLQRWGWSRRHANRQVEAANTVEILGPTGPTVHHGAQIPNERVARELTPLTKEDPKTAGRVLDDLVEEHGDKLTGAHAKKAVQDVFEATAIREQLPPKTRAVIEDAEDSSMPRNPAQMKHLKNIANKRGDERAAETAERVANGEFTSTFEAYPDVKAETFVPPSRVLSAEQENFYETPKHVLKLRKLDPEREAEEWLEVKDDGVKIGPHIRDAADAKEYYATLEATLERLERQHRKETGNLSVVGEENG